MLAFFLANEAIAKLGVNRSASFAGMSTAVAIISGALLLHEQLGIGQVLGAVLIITGVLIANIGARKTGESEQAGGRING